MSRHDEKPQIQVSENKLNIPLGILCLLMAPIGPILLFFLTTADTLLIGGWSPFVFLAGFLMFRSSSTKFKTAGVRLIAGSIIAWIGMALLFVAILSADWTGA